MILKAQPAVPQLRATRGATNANVVRFPYRGEGAKPGSETDVLARALGLEVEELRGPTTLDAVLRAGEKDLSHLGQVASDRVEALRRLLCATESLHRPLVDTTRAASRVIVTEAYRHRGEVLGLLLLDREHRLVGNPVIAMGGAERAEVSLADIVRRAAQFAAPSAVLWHTHPFGAPRPSQEDLDATRRIAEALRIVGVRMLDHIILTDPTRYLSLRSIDRALFEAAS